MTLNPFIIPVFISQSGCPHQCVFCNQEVITGTACKPNFTAAQHQAYQTVQTYLAFQRDKRRKVELAFFGGNFLGQSVSQLSWYMQLARSLYQAGLIDALRFSTRPDTINSQTLSFLQAIPIALVELGVQSLHDDVLALAGRGHTARATVQALKLLARFGLKVGVQIMTGLPGDTPAKATETAAMLAKYNPVCARIYPTLVLPGSLLATYYHAGNYRPQTLFEAVHLTAELYRIFTRHNVKVIRMGLQTADDLAANVIAGPYHPAFGHLVKSRLFLERLEVWFCHNSEKRVHIKVHPGQLSHLRGLSNANVNTLAERFPAVAFSFGTGNNLAPTELAVNGVLMDVLD